MLLSCVRIIMLQNFFLHLKAWDGEYYVARFVNTEEKLKKCKEAGFSGAMTSTVELWNKKFEK